MASLQLVKRATVRNAEEYKHVHSARYNSKLKGPHLLALSTRRRRHHSYDSGDLSEPLHQVHPQLSCRTILQPRGPEETNCSGLPSYEDDDAEMRRQLRQSNLTGAAGLVSLKAAASTNSCAWNEGEATRTRFLKWLDVMSSRRDVEGDQSPRGF